MSRRFFRRLQGPTKPVDPLGLRTLRWFDGALAATLLAFAGVCAVIVISGQLERPPLDASGRTVFIDDMSPLMFVFGTAAGLQGGAFLVPYLLLHRGHRWQWLAHLPPVGVAGGLVWFAIRLS